MDTNANIMSVIIQFMGAAQAVTMQNFDKKAYVMNKLRSHFGDETFLRYQPFISVTIDFIKEIVKNKAILKDIAKRRGCLK